MSINNELYQKLLDASNLIHNKKLSGSGDFIIINFKTAEILKKYESKRKKKEERIKKLKNLEKISNSKNIKKKLNK